MTALVADASIAFGVVLIVALAVMVAVIGFFGLILKALAAIFRAVFGIPRRHEHERVPRAAGRGGVRVCGNAGCGHENPSRAAFCGRCGRRLV